ncbi:MAG: chromosome segregation protein SMC [Pseudomonadales bacterium]
MRLKCIKLAGFKSFVDPTTVYFPSNLCAVVGPNGCGKSNVIDAVRWVMGESSAKNLRGESMADVIFAGSSSRKPVGQASVELVFDNQETRLTGDLAAYAEISIRRKVIRDGTSQYYLNGTKCRRRDITDIFLGTGLGPRSYAIIEQGMISRMIDAKPEELRVFIEEAAGISKYKERRRETENRMRSTRENLERLEDIREELEKQLKTLKRQSESAAKFKEYKKEERLLKAQVQSMQWLELEDQGKIQRDTITEREIKLEAGIAQQRTVDAEIEANRSQLTESNEAFNEIQSRFYALGSDIARIEQTIQHQKDRLKELSVDLQQASSSSEEINAHLDADQHKLQVSISTLADIEPQLGELQRVEQEARDGLHTLEAQMRDWQASWDEFNQMAAKASQAAEVEQSRIQHIEQAQGTIQQRIHRLEEEQSNLVSTGDEEDLVSLGSELSIAELLVQQLTEENETLVSDIEQRRQHLRETNNELNSTRSELQQQRGKLASLEALQAAALGQRNNASAEWLELRGFAGNSKLGETLQVESGWEVALETVLGNCLQAIAVPSIEQYADQLTQIQSGNLVLLDDSANPPESPVRVNNSLLNKLTSGVDAQVSDLLHGVHVADTLDQALQARKSLSAGESIITRDGVWLGAAWLRLARDDDAQAGVLSRQAEVQTLTSQVQENETQERALQARVKESGESLLEMEHGLDSQQRKLTETARSQGEIRARISAKRVRLEEFALRKERASLELGENRGQLDEEAERLFESRSKLQDALDEMEKNDGQRTELLSSRDAMRSALERAREDARLKKDKHHEQAMQSRSLQSEIASLQQSVARMSIQAEQLNSRRSSLSEALAESEMPMAESAEVLEVKLEQRLRVENELGEARRALESVESQMRQLDEQRTSAEQAVQAVRSGLEQLRLQTQSLQVRQEGLVEQLAETQHEVMDVLQGLPEEAELPVWQQELERMGNRIQRLGAINLAAIEEYDQQLERKTYLDTQNDELQAALTTLENAIRKIDRETRSLFKETFDAVNSGLGELFPRVFGGGHAYLEMTGEDLLDTGIAIMARPPGKRNSTIHLLSGGEKALTAIALVFSIFQLRPAPFCMLDEVDAPLDDANVGRYARMVEEMSKSIQFIYISHNKIAMEMAKQLMGVTMHEAGVSRLVSVDVDEAVQLAAV